MFLARDTIGMLLGVGAGPFGGMGGGMAGGQYWSIFVMRLGASIVELGLLRSISSAVNMLLARAR